MGKRKQARRRINETYQRINMKKIVILGSTGSIGTQTLEIVRANPGEFEILGLCAHGNKQLLAEQAAEFKSKHVLLLSEAKNPEQELERLAATAEVDLVVNAISGYAGLLPTYAACKAGKNIALANKESIVMAGELIMPLAKKTGAQIFPIDSEHSAIWQALAGAKNDDIEKIILTASGGPFWGKNKKELEKVTPEQALNHPTWKMGKKVSVDSATLMNKAFEIIEARWLFDIPAEKIDVSIHRQSIVHSFVQFTDGNMIAVMARPNMSVPISYALFYPNRMGNALPRVDLQNLNLTFEKPDYSLLPGPKLACELLKTGGIMPAALCVADEIAVNKFLNGQMSFLGIYDLINRVIGQIKNEKLSIATLKELPQKINSLIES